MEFHERKKPSGQKSHATFPLLSTKKCSMERELSDNSHNDNFFSLQS
jgi:hypothetical protein